MKNQLFSTMSFNRNEFCPLGARFYGLMKTLLFLLAFTPAFAQAQANLLTTKLDPNRPYSFALPDGAALVVGIADSSLLTPHIKTERPKWVWYSIGNPQRARYWLVVNQDFEHPVLVEAMTPAGTLMTAKPFRHDITDLRVLNEMNR